MTYLMTPVYLLCNKGKENSVKKEQFYRYILTDREVAILGFILKEL